VIPTIDALYKLMDEIRQHEIRRALQKYDGQIDQETQALLDRVTRAMVQKILHYPVVQLKVEDEHQQEYMEALTKLFKLDTEDFIDRYLYHPKRVKAHHSPHLN
jgi:glutamyl-tRNA reductase